MKSKFRNLTLSQVLLFVVFPFLEGDKYGLILLIVLDSVILFFAICAVSYQRKNAIIASLLGLPWFFLTWAELFFLPPSLLLSVISYVFWAFFYLFTALLILFYVLKSSKVTGDFLYGAISVYMLIGNAWHAIYLVIYSFQPNAFVIGAAHNIDGVVSWSELLYFSFITLTTLGYGDIVPVTSSARSFAMLEAIIGVMYLAIIISRLVGFYIAQAMKEQPK